jgi:N-acetylmuramate 1-kinase
MSDQRFAALSDWVAQTLNDARVTLEPASGDASFRRYFRARNVRRGSFIVMDAPPDKEDCRPYVRVGQAFRAIGLNVPEILAQDVERGFLLLEDLGDRLYLDALTASSADTLYQEAMAALVLLQRAAHADFAWLPPYDAALLHREMELFREWYLVRHLGMRLSNDQQVALTTAFDRLTASALEQPQVAVHRDYHSRNLMVTAARNPGVLDFQDAVCGPVTYDLVSLLRDCYIAWPRERVEAWVRGYRVVAARARVPVGNDDARFMRWFDLMGAQRHLKATGIFARLNHRDGKPGYLKDIPRTLGYVRDVAARYPELAGLSALLRDIEPAEERAVKRA